MRIFVISCVLLLLSSCGEKEEIQSYKVPKHFHETSHSHHHENTNHKPEPKKSSENESILAAMVEHQKKVWFLKIRGGSSKVKTLKKDFLKVLKSLKFNDNTENPIDWKLPSSWKASKQKGMRYATLFAPNGLECSIIPLGLEASSQLSNINRWRHQIKLAPIEEADLKKVLNKLQIEGRDVVWVELISKTKAVESKPAHQSSTRPFQFQKPDAWKEIPGQGMRKISFQLAKHPKSEFDFSVIALGAQAGSIKDNVLRWAKQVEMSFEEKELDKYVQAKTQGKLQGHFVQLCEKKEGIIAFIYPYQNQTWFFKLKGNSSLIQEQQNSFLEFLSSIQF